MAIAQTLRRFLTQKRIEFSVVGHPHTASSMETAAMAHVPGDRVAKAVMVEDENGYLMVIIPSTYRLHFGRLHKALDRQRGLATERELGELFQDCEPGAVPPVGAAYGIDTVVDDTLLQQPDVYLEAGNHEELIHLSGEQFEVLMRDTLKGPYSEHV